MKQYSHSALKILGVVAGFAASIHGPSALAEAVTKPAAPMIAQVCETDAARLARAVFSLQVRTTLASSANCVGAGSAAVLAQGRIAVSAQTTAVVTAHSVAVTPVAAGVDPFPPPLTTARGFEPAERLALGQPASLPTAGGDPAAYRSQGPISTFGQDDAPVGLKLGLRF